MVLLGVAAGDDGDADVAYMAGKIHDLRVFPDEEGTDEPIDGRIGGAVLVVSQFTLYGDCRRGRRPVVHRGRAAGAGRTALRGRRRGSSARRGLHRRHRRLPGDMEVELVNDGPVTILIDSAKAF